MRGFDAWSRRGWVALLLIALGAGYLARPEGLSPSCRASPRATCTGSANCRACKDCSHCKPCRGGGSCGFCRTSVKSRPSSVDVPDDPAFEFPKFSSLNPAPKAAKVYTDDDQPENPEPGQLHADKAAKGKLLVDLVGKGITVVDRSRILLKGEVVSYECIVRRHPEKWAVWPEKAPERAVWLDQDPVVRAVRPTSPPGEVERHREYRARIEEAAAREAKEKAAMLAERQAREKRAEAMLETARSLESTNKARAIRTYLDVLPLVAPDSWQDRKARRRLVALDVTPPEFYPFADPPKYLRPMKAAK